MIQQRSFALGFLFAPMLAACGANPVDDVPADAPDVEESPDVEVDTAEEPDVQPDLEVEPEVDATPEVEVEPEVSDAEIEDVPLPDAPEEVTPLCELELQMHILSEFPADAQPEKILTFGAFGPAGELGVLYEDALGDLWVSESLKPLAPLLVSGAEASAAQNGAWYAFDLDGNAPDELVFAEESGRTIVVYMRIEGQLTMLENLALPGETGARLDVQFGRLQNPLRPELVVGRGALLPAVAIDVSFTGRATEVRELAFSAEALDVADVDGDGDDDVIAASSGVLRAFKNVDWELTEISNSELLVPSRPRSLQAGNFSDDLFSAILYTERGFAIARWTTESTVEFSQLTWDYEGPSFSSAIRADESGRDIYAAMTDRGLRVLDPRAMSEFTITAETEHYLGHTGFAVRDFSPEQPAEIVTFDGESRLRTLPFNADAEISGIRVRPGPGPVGARTALAPGYSENPNAVAFFGSQYWDGARVFRFVAENSSVGLSSSFIASNFDDCEWDPGFRTDLYCMGNYLMRTSTGPAFSSISATALYGDIYIGGTPAEQSRLAFSRDGDARWIYVAAARNIVQFSDGRELPSGQSLLFRFRVGEDDATLEEMVGFDAPVLDLLAGDAGELVVLSPDTCAIFRSPQEALATADEIRRPAVGSFVSISRMSTNQQILTVETSVAGLGICGEYSAEFAVPAGATVSSAFADADNRADLLIASPNLLQTRLAAENFALPREIPTSFGAFGACSLVDVTGDGAAELIAHDLARDVVLEVPGTCAAP